MPPFVVACALLVLAGLFKLRSPASARTSLQTLGIRVPALSIRALGLLEVALGGLAAVRPDPLTAILVAAAYASFLLTTLALIRSGESADCGCFGAAGATVGRAHGIFNGLACAVAAGAAVTRPPGLLWTFSRSPLVGVTLPLGMIAAAYAAYAVFTLFAPAWRSYGSEGAL